MPTRSAAAWSLSIVLTVLLLTAGCAIKPAPREEPKDDSLKIAFNSPRNGNYEVYLMSPDGSDVVNVSRNPATDWVYHGDSRLVFASSRSGDHEPGNYDLFISDRRGTEVRQLTTFPVFDSYVGCAPDGERFVVASRKDGDLELYVIDGQGRELAQLTDNDAQDSDPDWSPDGSRIVFRSDRGGAWDLWVMNADGTGAEQLTEVGDNDLVHGYQGEGPPRWSPDGELIVFFSWHDEDFEIVTIRPDGSDRRQLTDNDSDDGWPCWSPDGRFIAFDSDRDGNSEIYVMDADGGNQRRLTRNDAPDQAPVWVR